MAGEAGAHLQRVVLDYRLPRVLLGGLVGAHFALAGYLLQLITRNPWPMPGCWAFPPAAAWRRSLCLSCWAG
ncbi:iron ABC transporter permease [Oceanimonas sp. NS1]|nr:iron ABC transporter permease [Oceanimonas sp. NS1]